MTFFCNVGRFKIHLIILKGYKKKLFAMIRQFGPLMFFITFTSTKRL
jgi:hypothetical protein